MLVAFPNIKFRNFLEISRETEERREKRTENREQRRELADKWCNYHYWMHTCCISGPPHTPLNQWPTPGTSDT